ncbi:MAG: bifunctional molybdenum cofactor biosynthesis protein MoaC/MoaB [Bacteroidetes bacterium]|nr:bifunctional molybdenum cofactor biosynthesis protein MoaC/MoaB [Bacteroidota bacterium]MCZ2133357.1 bifunctional molybdenum cofactor biosynthesis protein MoaC/MoaB [Bacteroidota bacterium]
MIDITGKIKTLRSAAAQAVVKVSKPETIEAVINKTVPKGDVLEASRVAGLFAIKRTADMIPDCHPLPIEFAAVRHTVRDMEIIVEAETHTIYRTGVEVEAMHGVSIAALTIYDMLKPIDKGIEINNIKLVKKKGGKSQYSEIKNRTITAHLIVCSDSISAGTKQDSAGKAIIGKLEKSDVLIQSYRIIPDEIKIIQDNVQEIYESGTDLIILTGGTGLSARDVTPEAIRPMLDREIPGIGEAARGYGQEKTPYSMLSRSLAGLKGKTLIIALPGSTKGAAESMDALFPYALHIFKVIDAIPHE